MPSMTSGQSLKMQKYQSQRTTDTRNSHDAKRPFIAFVTPRPIRGRLQEQPVSNKGDIKGTQCLTKAI